MEKKKPLFIAFSTQKGGVGKSAFTALAASHYHYNCGLNVLIIDCDKSQHSLMRMRERDQEIVESDPTLNELFLQQYEEIQKPAYTIIYSAAGDAVEVAEDYIEKSQMQYDIVMFDMVGTVESDGVMACVAQLDYIFMPISADHLVMESSLAFALTVKKMLMDDPLQPLKGIYLFWNKVVATERTTLYDDYSSVINDMEIQILNTYIPDMVRYKRELRRGRKEIFRSTLFPASPSLVKGSRIDDLILEVSQILKLDIDNGQK